MMSDIARRVSANSYKQFDSWDGYRAVQLHYSHLLRHYPVRYVTTHVPTRYGDTHLTISGAHNAPPLIVLHGLGLHSLIWWPNVAALSRHFQVILVDVIGDAGRSAPTRPSMLDASYALWLQDVLDELALERVQVAAQSLGGWVALLTALHLPQRIGGLFLIAPAGLTTLNTSLMGQAAFGTLFHFGNPRFTVAGLMARLAGDDAQMAELIRLCVTHHKPKPVPPTPILTDDELAQIHTPTSIIIGTDDQMFAADALFHRTRLLGGFAGAEVIPHAGHGINVTHAEFVSQRIADFFR
ncbi:MAG: alpha/beta fold hydrolase [Phototrophicaceae bacterium]